MCIALLWYPWRPEVYEYVKYTNLETFWVESEIEMQTLCQTVRAIYMATNGLHEVTLNLCSSKMASTASGNNSAQTYLASKYYTTEPEKFSAGPYFNCQELLALC